MTSPSQTWNNTEQWNALLSYLPAEFRELATEHKQIEMQYGNAKVTTADDLLRLIFLHVGPNLPLRQTVILAQEGGGPRLSAMRLHMKMRKASPYLHGVGIDDGAHQSPDRLADLVIGVS